MNEILEIRLIESKLIAAALFVAANVASAHATPDSAPFSLAPATNLPSPVTIKMDVVGNKPVLQRGACRGQWDSVDLLNPSVIRFKGKLYNYYSGYDGRTWHTGLATSIDGMTWEKYAANPILSPHSKDWDVSYISANGSAIAWKGKILYFYQGVDRRGRTQIGLATSEDGVSFSKRGKPVFTVGQQHTWESQAVGDPYVIEKDGYLYLYYLGQDDMATQRLGVARSADGITWRRSPANPILDVGAYDSFDENGLGEPSVAYSPLLLHDLYRKK
ncbi:glycoside hydrolase family 130 protein [Cupriavidus basilensis]